jgi:predicted methyltransferase
MTKATQLAHLLIRSHLLSQPDSHFLAIDATVGNGFDTVFLAECVEEKGTVYGFDIQDMQEASRKATQNGFAERITFFQAGHETMLAHLPHDARGGVHAIMFNLGYLPRGDKSIVTTPQTTIPALEQSLALLAPGGILSITCYPGHAVGNEETAAISSWASALPKEEYRVLRCHCINQNGAPPELIVVTKFDDTSSH